MVYQCPNGDGRVNAFSARSPIPHHTQQASYGNVAMHARAVANTIIHHRTTRRHADGCLKVAVRVADNFYIDVSNAFS